MFLLCTEAGAEHHNQHLPLLENRPSWKLLLNKFAWCYKYRRLWSTPCCTSAKMTRWWISFHVRNRTVRSHQRAPTNSFMNHSFFSQSCSHPISPDIRLMSDVDNGPDVILLFQRWQMSPYNWACIVLSTSHILTVQHLKYSTLSPEGKRRMSHSNNERSLIAC